MNLSGGRASKTPSLLKRVYLKLKSLLSSFKGLPDLINMEGHGLPGLTDEIISLESEQLQLFVDSGGHL